LSPQPAKLKCDVAALQEFFLSQTFPERRDPVGKWAG